MQCAVQQYDQRGVRYAIELHILSLSPNTNDCIFIFIFGNPFFLDCRRLSLMSAVIAKYAFRETEMEVRCEM